MVLTGKYCNWLYRENKELVRTSERKEGKMSETMNVLCGTSITDIQMICGTVFWCVAFIGMYVTICVLRYLKLEHDILVGEDTSKGINRLHVMVSKPETELTEKGQ